LITFQNMIIYVPPNTFSQHPQWLKVSWIISSNSMEFPNLLSSTMIQISPTIFDKNCSISGESNCISSQPTIARLMVKLKLSTIYWKHIWGVSHDIDKLNGISGYHSPNGVTTHLTMLPFAWLPLKKYIVKSHLLYSPTFLFLQAPGCWQNPYSMRCHSLYPKREFGHCSKSHEETSQLGLFRMPLCW